MSLTGLVDYGDIVRRKKRCVNKKKGKKKKEMQMVKVIQDFLTKSQKDLPERIS